MMRDPNAETITNAELIAEMREPNMQNRTEQAMGKIHESFQLSNAVRLGNGGVPRPLTFDLLAELELALGQHTDGLLMHPDVLSTYEDLFCREGRDPQDRNVFLYSWRGMCIWTNGQCPQGTVFLLGRHSSGTVEDIATTSGAK